MTQRWLRKLVDPPGSTEMATRRPKIGDASLGKCREGGPGFESKRNGMTVHAKLVEKSAICKTVGNLKLTATELPIVAGVPPKVLCKRRFNSYQLSSLPPLSQRLFGSPLSCCQGQNHRSHIYLSIYLNKIHNIELYIYTYRTDLHNTIDIYYNDIMI